MAFWKPVSGETGESGSRSVERPYRAQAVEFNGRRMGLSKIIKRLVPCKPFIGHRFGRQAGLSRLTGRRKIG
jgi:hypothetical protein